MPGERRREARARLVAVELERQLEHVDADRVVGPQALARRRERRQVALVEDDARRDRGVGGGDQRARELRLAEHRLGGDDDEQLVDVGGERLGLPLVAPIEERRARQDLLDHALVAGALPAHAVADDRFAALAARVAEHARAVRTLDDEPAAVTGDDPARALRDASRGRRRGHRPWRRR